MAVRLPTGWLADTLALYGRVFRRGAGLALRHWPVGLVVPFYLVLLGLVARVAAPFGIVGYFAFYLVWVACMSSWLSLAEQVIRVGRVQLADLPAGFGAYFGDLLTVGFLLWLLGMTDRYVLAPFPLLSIVFRLAVFVFLNAVPELIYLGRHAAAELLVESYRFIGENWIEWFPPNVALAVGIAALAGLPIGPYVLLPVLGVVLYFFTIVRGLLFLELSTSNRRAREFQRRAAG